MIGNYEDAKLAATLPYKYVLSTNGSTRGVYLINNVVYKVEYDSYPFYNPLEYDNANTMREELLTLGICVPKVELFANNVLAMEYIAGEPTGECIPTFIGNECDCGEGQCFEDSIRDMLNSLDITDLAYGNLMWSNGQLWIIDLAE